MNAFIASNKGMYGGLAGVICAGAIVLGTAYARSQGDHAAPRTFEQEKAIALKAIAQRHELAARGRDCLERAQSVDQMSDCLDAEYRGRAELDGQLHPLKSRPEMMAEDPGVI